MKKSEKKNCRVALERLHESYEGFSVSGDPNFFKMHLAGCRACRERSEEFRETMDLLNMASLYPVPEGFHSSLKTRLDGVEMEQDGGGEGSQLSGDNSVVADRADSEESILWDASPQPASKGFSGKSRYRRAGMSVLLLLVGAIAALAVAWAAGILVVSNENSKKSDERSFMLDPSAPKPNPGDSPAREMPMKAGDGRIYFQLSREVLRLGEIKVRGVWEMIRSTADSSKKREKEKLQNNIVHSYHESGGVKHSQRKMSERNTGDNAGVGISKRLTRDDNKISPEVGLKDKDKKELRKLLKKKRQKNRARLDEKLQKSLRRRENHRVFDEKDGRRLHGHSNKRSGAQGGRD